jgi:hypothetical protein
VHFRPDPPLCREVSIQLASIRTSQQPVQTPLDTRPVSDSFQVPINERSIKCPDDVVSRPDARLLKARIVIQISPSGSQSALVRTHVQPVWKLPIRLQPSKRAHSRYGNCVLKFSHPDAHLPWSGRAKPYKEITCSGRATIWTMCHPVQTRLLNRKDFSAKFSENPLAQLSVRTAMTTVRTVPSYILPDDHLSLQPINRGPWALRTTRIRY